MSSSSTPHALIPLVERALSAVWNIDVRLKVEWIASNQLASHVFRVRTHATGHDLPPTLIVKAAKPEFDLGSQEMVFNEWAALIHLQQIGCDPAVAARFHAGHLDDRGPFVVMEDLGTGEGSPAAVSRPSGRRRLPSASRSPPTFHQPDTLSPAIRHDCSRSYGTCCRMR